MTLNSREQSYYLWKKGVTPEEQFMTLKRSYYLHTHSDNISWSNSTAIYFIFQRFLPYCHCTSEGILSTATQNKKKTCVRRLNEHYWRETVSTKIEVLGIPANWPLANWALRLYTFYTLWLDIFYTFYILYIGIGNIRPIIRGYMSVYVRANMDNQLV